VTDAPGATLISAPSTRRRTTTRSRPRRGSTTSRSGAPTGSGCRAMAGASWSASRRSTRRSLVEELCRTQSRLCRGLGAGREKLGKKTCERGGLEPLAEHRKSRRYGPLVTGGAPSNPLRCYRWEHRSRPSAPPFVTTQRAAPFDLYLHTVSARFGESPRWVGIIGRNTNRRAAAAGSSVLCPPLRMAIPGVLATIAAGP
jgi:hypothetical protein